MPTNKKSTVKRGMARSGGVHVGDRVQVLFGTRKVSGKIVEDRGKIGVKRRNLYRILVKMGDEPTTLELPADEFQVTKRATPEKKTHVGMKKEKTVRVQNATMSS